MNSKTIWIMRRYCVGDSTPSVYTPGSSKQYIWSRLGSISATASGLNANDRSSIGANVPHKNLNSLPNWICTSRGPVS